MKSAWLCVLVIAALMAGCLVLAACGGEEEEEATPTTTPVARGVPMFRGNPARTGVNPGTGEERWRFETGDSVTSSPAVVDGVVYIGGQDRYVYALDAATGEERWHFGTNGSVRSSPAVVDGVVYVGSMDNYVYAITEE